MTNSRPLNSHELLALLLARWSARHVNKLICARFGLHEVSIAHEQRLRRLFRTHGLHLTVVRQSSDVVMMIFNHHLQPVEMDALPVTIAKFQRPPTGDVMVVPELIEIGQATLEDFDHAINLSPDWVIYRRRFWSGELKALCLENIHSGQRIGLRLHQQ